MWKSLKDNVYGHYAGDIFEAPLHAVQSHLDKGEIIEFKELPKIESVNPEETSAIPLEEAPKKRGRKKV